MTHKTPSRFTTVDEVASELGRPRSTVAHWAAGSRPGFPVAIRLPNSRLLIERTAWESWRSDAVSATGR